MNITTSIFTILNKVLDVALVWCLVYFFIKNFKNNVKLSLLLKGFLILVLLSGLARILNLTTLGLMLEYMITWGPLALVIIFQPEIRLILEEIGRKKLIGRHKILTVDEREKIIYEVINSVESMRKERIGALIVIERDVSLNDYVEKSKKIYGEVTSFLLQAIFFPDNPLHDGGVIIQGDKISCAGAVFPTSNNLKANQKRLGTRHRAALGISEETDAIVVVVSEETGKLSLVIKGELYYGVSIDDLRVALIDELRPQKETTDSFKVSEEEEIYEENK